MIKSGCGRNGEASKSLYLIIGEVVNILYHKKGKEEEED